MSSKLLAWLLPLLLMVPIMSQAAPGQPNFMPAVWGDGQVWGTKGNNPLPAPTDKNLQSFDRIYIILNNPDAPQLPVSEAAPGNPAYNGGRWFVFTAMWTAAGLAAYDPVPVLTSYAEVQQQVDLGYLVATPGSFDGGPPAYFQCPLLPIMGN